MTNRRAFPMLFLGLLAVVVRQSVACGDLPTAPVRTVDDALTRIDVGSSNVLVSQFDTLSTYNAIPRLTFRGDSRGPSTIFNAGFEAGGSSTNLLAHAWDNTHPPSAFISTSKSASVASGFDEYLYVVHPRNGIDVNAVLGKLSPYPHELEVAIPWQLLPTDVRAVTIQSKGISILNPNWRR